jgi:hypothetical protein
MHVFLVVLNCFAALYAKDEDRSQKNTSPRTFVQRVTVINDRIRLHARLCHSSVPIVVYIVPKGYVCNASMSIHMLFVYLLMQSISKSRPRPSRPLEQIPGAHMPEAPPIQHRATVNHPYPAKLCETHIEPKCRIDKHLSASLQERVHRLELRCAGLEYYACVLASFLLNRIQLIRDRSAHRVPARF